ncbi:MAG: thymidine phosphorylase [Defluviitaleaceae bacterium]|nr:thymidine phosphorylase [Defluviitaleaceae bacterium]
MRIFDIINKKKQGRALTAAEIAFAVDGYTHGTIGDGPMAALLMAICLNGLNRRETAALTMAMANSGEIANLSAIGLPVVDKHSTGGVGDKLTLIVGPMVAAAGLAVAKMSGRSLGHTGGTIDKLESIPGFSTNITPPDFIRQVNKIGICIAGQSTTLAPADKKIYALRDATATVDSMPLIAASIMSKKIASGADSILLDVKAGSGAFMKTPAQARQLAKIMIEIGRDCGKNMAAMVSAMDAPLGRCVGKWVEVAETIEVLKGHGDPDLVELSIELSAHMLFLGDKGSIEECKALAKAAITTGAAYNKFLEMVAAQGGDVDYVRNASLSGKTPAHCVLSPQSGYVSAMDGEKCGIAANMLTNGIIFHVKPGEYTEKGQPLAQLHCHNQTHFAAAEILVLSAYEFSATPPKRSPIIHLKLL